jgi:hypothetical protein
VHKLAEINGNMTKSFLKECFSSVKQLADIESNLLASVITGLYITKDGIGISLDEYIDSIVSSVTNTDETPSEHSKDVLRKLLTVDGDLQLIGKAMRLFRARDNVLGSSQIVTDVRPIFSDAPGCEITASTIIHTLRLEYKDVDGNNTTFSIGIDSVDIKELRDALDRASAKELVLKSQLATTTLKMVDLV